MSDLRDENICEILNSPILIFCIEQILKERNYDLKASPFMDWWEKSSNEYKEDILRSAKLRINEEQKTLYSYIRKNGEKFFDGIDY